MKQRRYTAEEKAWVLEQMAPPLSRTVCEMAKETGITTVSLRTWRNEAKAGGVFMPGTGKREGRWSSADKFRAVLQTATLSESESAEYCRAKAIEPGQLAAWRHACERANDASQTKPAVDVTALKRIEELQKELRRKEAALAEAAALLVLRKKADAIWGKDEAE
jgi:transposase-like protein